MLNEYYQNIGIKGFIKRYGLFNGFRRGFYTAWPIHNIKDYEMKKVIWQKKAQQHINKYLRYKDVDTKDLSFGECSVNNPIWIFWNSGYDCAPQIIKCCIDSVRRIYKEQVIIIDDYNIEKYIHFPKYVTDKVEKGIMPMAHYTDLMRFALLEHYGGTWIDATVFLTDRIPEPILESDFFAFRNALGLLDNPVLYPVWFMHAKKGNEIIRRIRNVAFSFWKRKNHIIEYLQSNLILTSIIEDANCEKEILYMNSDYSEHLIRIIGDEYTSQTAEWIKKLTSIHKLTYKLDESVNKENSIYRAIIEDRF